MNYSGPLVYDALLLLCNSQEMKKSALMKQKYDNEGDSETFKKIYEIAKKYRRLEIFITNHNSSNVPLISDKSERSHGLYIQALSEGIDSVLEPYRNLLIDVERQLIDNKNYTLYFVYSYFAKYLKLFTCLNQIISNVINRNLYGCQILDNVYRNILNGDVLVHQSMLKIFKCIYEVFLNQVCFWTLYGELDLDPFEEFFVKKSEGNRIPLSPNSSGVTSNGTPNSNDILEKSLSFANNILEDSALECGHNLEATLIPSFIPLSLAQDILFIGRTIILIGIDPTKTKKKKSFLPVYSYRRGKSKSFTIWDDKKKTFHEKFETLATLDEFDVDKIILVVKEIKEYITKHLWIIAVEEANLIHEIRLMKDFYLLGRGELFAEFLRLSAHRLDNTSKGSSSVINDGFRNAARAVYLNNDPDLEKFWFELPIDKSILQESTSSAHVKMNRSREDETASTDSWNSIILQYDVKWPLHLLFTPEVLARYNDMFRILLRIKRTQQDLHGLWKILKQSKCTEMFQLHNKLMFVMNNLQHYLQADVLETNFSILLNTIETTNDFEVLKNAHATFLCDVLSQSFVNAVPTSSKYSDTETLDNPVFVNILELLSLCETFCEMANTSEDQDFDDYYIRGFTEKFNKLVKKLMQLLVSVRDLPCGIYLARLLIRLDYNRWLSKEAQLTQSVTNIIR